MTCRAFSMHQPGSFAKWIPLLACLIGACGRGQSRPDHPGEAGGGEQDSGYVGDLAVDVDVGGDAEPGADKAVDQDLGRDALAAPDSDELPQDARGMDAERDAPSERAIDGDGISQEAGSDGIGCGDTSCGPAQICAFVGNRCTAPLQAYECPPGLVFQASSPPCCVPPIPARCADIDLPCEGELTCSCFSADPCPVGRCLGSFGQEHRIVCSATSY